MFRKVWYILSITVLASLLMVQGQTALAADSTWTARYWNNKTFSGSAVLIRQENNINYDWGTGSPANEVKKDLFSARWTRNVNFEAAKYRFTATSDDGIRVWVDDKLVIDQWTDHTVQTFTGDITLSAGDHKIKVEYYEGGGDAVAKVSWAKAPANDPTYDKWKGEYFNNKNLSGTPAVVRNDNSINFDWGTGKPASGVNADNFSVRWTRTLNFEGKTYRFTARSDDGIRVWVDGSKIIDAWYPQTATTHTRDIAMSKGNHTIKVEYFDSGGDALAQFSYAVASAPSPTINNWKGEYFNNLSLSGSPTLVRDDQNVNFDWGTGSPAGGINADNFSVRWTRTLNFTAGTYRFTTVSDDGMRVWVDGSKIIDVWYDHAPQTHTADIALNGGNHTVKIEYYDKTMGATAKVSWATVTSQPTITNWKGEYFNNLSLSGTPTLVRDDANINFDWGVGRPQSGINSDNFSVRWTRTLNFAAGTYRFTTVSDDGMRVWVDGKILIDKWYDHAAETHVADIALTAGNHTVKVEYYDRVGSAVAKVSWATVSSSPPPSSPPPSSEPVPGGSVVTVDNSSAGFTKGGLTTDWFTQNIGVNGSSLWTNNMGGATDGYNWARWYPGIKGKYEVFVFIPAGNATITNARYWVHTSAGYTLRIVNQSANQGKWVSLGTYVWSGASYEYVSLSDVNFEPNKTSRVVFDAVKFEPRQ